MTESHEENVALAMLALRASKRIEAREFVEAWKENWPTEPTPRDCEREEEVLSIRIAGRDIIVAAMEAPIPESGMERAHGRSWMWPESREAMADHRDHLLVVVRGPDMDPVEASMLLTRVITALIAVTDAVGVYWGAADLLTEAAEFAQGARESFEEGGLPVHRWVSIAVSREEGRSTATTCGLEAFGQKEMEIIESRQEPGDVLDFLGNVVGHVVEHGPVLEHGQTIGLTPKQKIKIDHRASEFDPERQVIRLWL